MLLPCYLPISLQHMWTTYVVNTTEYVSAIVDWLSDAVWMHTVSQLAVAPPPSTQLPLKEIAVHIGFSTRPLALSSTGYRAVLGFIPVSDLNFHHLNWSRPFTQGTKMQTKWLLTIEKCICQTTSAIDEGVLKNVSKESMNRKEKVQNSRLPASVWLYYLCSLSLCSSDYIPLFFCLSFVS